MPFDFTVTIKPAGGGTYASLASFLADVNAGTYGNGSSPVSILALCDGGDLGVNPTAWNLTSLASQSGNMSITIQSSSPLAAISDSNPYCKTLWSGFSPSSSVGLGSITFDGIQFGMSTTNGRLVIGCAAGGIVEMRNCIGFVSQNVAGSFTVFNATPTGGAITRENNFVYIGVNQSSTTIMRCYMLVVTTGNTVNYNDYHNAVCNNSSVVPTTHIAAFVLSYAGTLNWDFRYCASLGPNSSTAGVTTITGTGTLNQNAASDFNVMSDTSGTTFSPGGNGVNSKLNTDAWGSLGDRTIIAGSCLAGLGTSTPTGLDYLGTVRPQSGLVDGGPFEIVRLVPALLFPIRRTPMADESVLFVAKSIHIFPQHFAPDFIQPSPTFCRMRIIRPENFQADWAGHTRRIAPRLIDYGARLGAARGLYRVFNAAGYRFYRSNVAPPATGDTPFATNGTLPFTPASTFADGTWYLSMSYFDGVLDSGFLPVGPHGETYLVLVVAGGVAVANGPSQPGGATLLAMAAGVIRITAHYSPIPDGANAATEWAIAYTIDGSTPASGSPTITRKISNAPLSILSVNLPAQAQGTVVKVQLQVRRPSLVYSTPLPVLTAIANLAGPSTPLGLQTWAGALPEEV